MSSLSETMRQQLVSFLNAILDGQREKNDWFDPNVGICSNWVGFTWDVADPIGFRTLIGHYVRDWKNWPLFSGEGRFPIPVDMRNRNLVHKISSGKKAGVMYQLMSRRRKGELWQGEQLALRLDLCHWLLAELENAKS